MWETLRTRRGGGVFTQTVSFEASASDLEGVTREYEDGKSAVGVLAPSTSRGGAYCRFSPLLETRTETHVDIARSPFARCLIYFSQHNPAYLRR